jgi:preprotein translocase subunit SecF
MVDFVGLQRYSFSFFALVVLTFFGMYFYRGGFHYSVDFTGGTQLIVRFDKAVSVGQVRDILRNEGMRADVSAFDKSDVRIRIPEMSVDETGLGQKIQESLQKSLPDTRVDILQNERVSSSIGRTLIRNAMWAILLALVAILGYIFIRFKFSFAVGAISALIHDTFIILTAFLLLNWDISVDVIAAILMILAYSNNDTIVIFSRIRERMARNIDNKRMAEVTNEAIWDTLSRTLLTSFATALVVLSLLIFGGETLRNLSFALLIGIIFGTYSSIFIASPVMLLFYRARDNQLAKAPESL